MFAKSRSPPIGNGAGAFVQTDQFEVGADPWCVRPFDVNGDALPDLVVANALSDAVSIVVGAGTGSLSGATFFDVQSYPLFATAADLDEDGIDDLVAANAHASSVSILLNRTLQGHLCLEGNVNEAAGAIADVLLVNGSAGANRARTIRVATSDAFELRVENPPSRGAARTRFALYAWIGAPSDSTMRDLPYGLGKSCMPTPVTADGPPNPVRIWNTIGLAQILGEQTAPSDRAPTTLLSLRHGLRRVATLT